jgi:hypothetical protein
MCSGLPRSTAKATMGIFFDNFKKGKADVIMSILSKQEYPSWKALMPSRLEAMLVWYIGEYMAIVININIGIREPTRGYQILVFDGYQNLVFDGYVKVRESLYT